CMYPAKHDRSTWRLIRINTAMYPYCIACCLSVDWLLYWFALKSKNGLNDQFDRENTRTRTDKTPKNGTCISCFGQPLYKPPFLRLIPHPKTNKNGQNEAFDR